MTQKNQRAVVLAFTSSIGCADGTSTRPVGIESDERGCELIVLIELDQFSV